MKSQKGQAIVELALSLSVLVLFLFGIIDIGRIYQSNLALEHAGREGSRVASVGGDDSQIRQAVMSSTRTINQNNLTINIQPTIEQRKRGTEVKVTLTYSMQLNTPGIALLANPLQLNSATVMRVE
jgi:Flp pilus assembly protein TadG